MLCACRCAHGILLKKCCLLGIQWACAAIEVWLEDVGVSTVPSKLALDHRCCAAQVGARKVWLDPNEVNEISMANSSKLCSCPPISRCGMHIMQLHSPVGLGTGRMPRSRGA